MRRQLRDGEESGDSMKSLRWDGATLRKVRGEHSVSDYRCSARKVALSSTVRVIIASNYRTMRINQGGGT